MTNAMRLRGLRCLPLAYGRNRNQSPPREISDSYVQFGYRSAAIQRDTAKKLVGICNENTMRVTASFTTCELLILVAWAAEDHLLPRAITERLAAPFSNSTLEVITSSQTFTGEDHPVALAETILRFITASPLPGQASADSPMS